MERFYIKRATRILPPLIVTCVLTYLFTPGASILVVLGYFFTLGGLIDLHKNIFIEPLGPTWSLAVEEHFYLVWPFVIRFLDKKRALLLLFGVILGAPLLRMAFSHPMPTADLSVTYFLTPFRVDEMAFGCLLALLIEDTATVELLKRWAGWAFVGVTAVYFGAWVYLHHIYFYPGGPHQAF